MNESRRLESRLAALGSCIVAYSGGVDSSVVLVAARRALGDRALAVIGRSATYAEGELSLALAQARGLGVEPHVLSTAELDDPRFVGNPTQRCYFCKGELYARLSVLARERGITHVVDGTNADDLGDFRPGRRAAEEHGVLSPLVELGVTKDGVRALARHYGLPSAEKPAMPCLASRFPYGSRITPDALRRVERAETWLRERGFREVRVRFFGERARLEVERESLSRLTAPAFLAECEAALAAIGFREVEVDREGFRSGKLNQGLRVAAPALSARSEP